MWLLNPHEVMAISARPSTHPGNAMFEGTLRCHCILFPRPVASWCSHCPVIRLVLEDPVTMFRLINRGWCPPGFPNHWGIVRDYLCPTGLLWGGFVLLGWRVSMGCCSCPFTRVGGFWLLAV